MEVLMKIEAYLQAFWTKPQPSELCLHVVIAVLVDGVISLNLWHGGQTVLPLILLHIVTFGGWWVKQWIIKLFRPSPTIFHSDYISKQLKANTLQYVLKQ